MANLKYSMQDQDIAGQGGRPPQVADPLFPAPSIPPFERVFVR
jgi:hypothetical protein